MADMHKTPALALTLRGYIKHAPENWRAHMAAAADAVEECARLRAERDEARADALRWRWWREGRRDGLLPSQWDEFADRNAALKDAK